MKNFSARNPLGIIALFISLIYGISAILLGASVDMLTPENQERLVWFIICFPVGILLAFLYLVTWHHRKLYSPSDFRTDESFLTSGDPAAIGRKYIAEGETAAANSDLAPGDDEVSPGNDAADDTPTGSAGVEEESRRSGEDEVPSFHVARKSQFSSKNFAAYAYMIEGLVMQELQNEYKSPIRRDAVFPMPSGRTARVDGLIEGTSGPIIAEIKLVRPQVDFSRRLRDGFMQLSSYISSAREIMHPKTSGILVLVLDGQFNKDQIERIEAAVRISPKGDILVRILKSDDLMIKYGLLSPST